MQLVELVADLLPPALVLVLALAVQATEPRAPLLVADRVRLGGSCGVRNRSAVDLSTGRRIEALWLGRSALLAQGTFDERRTLGRDCTAGCRGLSTVAD